MMLINYGYHPKSNSQFSEKIFFKKKIIKKIHIQSINMVIEKFQFKK